MLFPLSLAFNGLRHQTRLFRRAAANEDTPIVTRILLADDDAGMRETLAEILELEGHRVEAVDTGPRAIARFRDLDFDVVVLDYRMPGMSGDQVHEQLLQIDPSVQVIMMSAFAVEEAKRLAFERGVLAFVDKPLEVDTFLELVRDMQRASVLVVTRDTTTEALIGLLRSKGLRVGTAASQATAVQLVQQFRFDIAILDCTFSPGNGLDMYLTLKQVSPDLDAIMLTEQNEASHEIARAAIRKTAYAYVDKPDASTRLPELLKRLIGQQRSGPVRAKPSN